MTRPQFEKHVLLTLGAVLTLTLSSVTGIATLATEMDKPQRCQLERTYKMVGYNCANLGLKQIPQTLKSNLQIFDLSFNRIRDLTRQSFARYSDVQYLYLFENMVQFVEPGTFSVMTNLEAIDLSSNALTTIPPELFQMPLLRNLYVAHNNLAFSDANPLQLELPVRAPLQIISLADCRLNRLPDFGILPDLWLLNISSNPMADLAVEQFAPLCNLRKLDMNDTRVEQCTCQEITVQLEQRRVMVLNSNLHCLPMYSSERKSCTSESSNDVNETKLSSPLSQPFLQCIEVLQSRKLNAKAKAAWFWIALAVLGCILLFCSVLYYVHNRNSKSRKALKNQANKRGQMSNGQPIHRIMEPSPDRETRAEDEKPIVENGTRDKLIENCD
uniref:Putative leucine-rich repeat protein n=1 Tax=Culex tarsalis TaxID=7177 RepID=A0A1Q3FP47_CULTA